ncbi:jg8413 [Pararge aegeria aegeria]|uniref:Jg8413 protein n=1 Tax=Pararge aegeria aegeria TaxID=348720 RepID=A0A8S4SG34_9NEOP|nr:jg8413 [Pararge aegeria aegeria]
MEKKNRTFLWTKRGGKHPLLLLQGYTYSYQKKNADGRVSWYCSRRLKGCRASAISLGTTAFAYKPHDHPQPRLPDHISNMMPVNNANLFWNYTYTYKVLSASGVLWHCSRRTRTGCKAFIKSHPDHIDRIQAVFDEHCHHPRLTPSRSKKALAEKLT